MSGKGLTDCRLAPTGKAWCSNRHRPCRGEFDRPHMSPTTHNQAHLRADAICICNFFKLSLSTPIPKWPEPSSTKTAASRPWNSGNVGLALKPFKFTGDFRIDQQYSLQHTIEIRAHLTPRERSMRPGLVHHALGLQDKNAVFGHGNP